MSQHYRPGFTLIELMIVVAILGIIAAIAIPNYQESVRKSRRADAKLLVTTTAQRLERCYADCNSYTTDTNCPNNTGCPITKATALGPLPIRSPDGNYELTAGNGTTIAVNSYTLTATPVAGKPQTSDAKCTSFSQTSAGLRTAAGTLGNNCWK